MEIGCHLPPKIKVQIDMELYGTSGMYVHCALYRHSEGNSKVSFVRLAVSFKKVDFLEK